MIKKRFITSQLEDIKENAKEGIDFCKKKKYPAADLELRKIYNVATAALKTESKKKRDSDNTGVFKRRKINQRVKVMRSDLKCLSTDLDHGNKVSGKNFIRLIRRGLTEMNRLDKSIRKSDTTNKMVDELRGC